MLKEILKDILLEIYYVFTGHLNTSVCLYSEVGLIIFLITFYPGSLGMINSEF